jgi:DNA-binding XRE family transcriptional regulator
MAGLGLGWRVRRWCFEGWAVGMLQFCLGSEAAKGPLAALFSSTFIKRIYHLWCNITQFRRDCNIFCKIFLTGTEFRCLMEWMAVHRAPTLLDRARQIEDIANRLGQAREGLGATQTEFAGQISISRDRLASYEDGRAVLRCDVALRVCRQFFVSEFWLATGAANEQQLKGQRRVAFSDLDARLTMALAVESAALACPPGSSFADGFDPFLRQPYARLAAEQNGFPRIKPLPSDGPEYFRNALDCMMDFWKRGLSPQQWEAFFSSLVSLGQSLHGEIKTMNPEGAWRGAAPGMDAVLTRLQQSSAAVGIKKLQDTA